MLAVLLLLLLLLLLGCCWAAVRYDETHGTVGLCVLCSPLTVD
jgi:hypothetical protein